MSIESSEDCEASVLLRNISLSEKSSSGVKGLLEIESKDKDLRNEILLCSSSSFGRIYFSGKFDSSESVLSADVFELLDTAKYLSGKTLKLLFRLFVEPAEELLFFRFSASS